MSGGVSGGVWRWNSPLISISFRMAFAQGQRRITLPGEDDRRYDGLVSGWHCDGAGQQSESGEFGIPHQEREASGEHSAQQAAGGDVSSTIYT